MAAFYECAGMQKNYDLIVFDWDGTVMDSTGVIAGSIQAACRDLGLPVPSDEDARHVIGLGLVQALRHAVPSAPESMYEPLAERYRHYFLAQDSSIPLYAGAEDTIRTLHESGYLLGVATGKSRAGLDRVLDASGLRGYFHATRTADQTFSKPHPAMLLEIMDELNVIPERTLMIGDTTHDVELAHNAGVAAVAVGHGAHPPEQLLALSPLVLVNDFTELRDWLKQHA